MTELIDPQIILYYPQKLRIFNIEITFIFNYVISFVFFFCTHILLDIKNLLVPKISKINKYSLVEVNERKQFLVQILEYVC
jgi:hypothetical protein